MTRSTGRRKEFRLGRGGIRKGIFRLPTARTRDKSCKALVHILTRDKWRECRNDETSARRSRPGWRGRCTADNRYSAGSASGSRARWSFRPGGCNDCWRRRRSNLKKTAKQIHFSLVRTTFSFCFQIKIAPHPSGFFNRRDRFVYFATGGIISGTISFWTSRADGIFSFLPPSPFFSSHARFTPAALQRYIKKCQRCNFLCPFFFIRIFLFLVIFSLFFFRNECIRFFIYPPFRLRFLCLPVALFGSALFTFFFLFLLFIGSKEVRVIPFGKWASY